MIWQLCLHTSTTNGSQQLVGDVITMMLLSKLPHLNGATIGHLLNLGELQVERYRVAAHSCIPNHGVR